MLILCASFLNCPKRVSPGSRQAIDVSYIGSLTDDIQRPDPYLSGTADLKGLKIGYLNTDRAGFALFLERLGFYRLIDEDSLDFIITNFPVFGQNHLPVPKTMGYGIKNVGGIRFAVMSLGKDSLTIHDQTQISICRERSDVLWIIENKVLAEAPFKISFLVANRTLQSTSQTKIKIRPDPERQKRIAAFARLLQDTLNVRVDLAGKSLAEYVLNRIGQRTGASVILYPASLVPAAFSRNQAAIRDLVDLVDGSVRFAKKTMARDSLLKYQKDNALQLWGKPGKTNSVLVPDPGGDYVLDLLLD